MQDGTPFVLETSDVDRIITIANVLWVAVDEVPWCSTSFCKGREHSSVSALNPKNFYHVEFTTALLVSPSVFL